MATQRWRPNAVVALSLAAILTTCPANVAASSVTLQPDSYLQYVPSLGGNAAVGAVYSVLCLMLFYHTFFNGPKVDKWMLCLPIGAFFEALGYFLRLPMRTSQRDMPLYTVMYLFVVLAPAAYLAFNYILFGRFIAALEGDKPSAISRDGRRSSYSFIPPTWVKRIFVISDVVTFIVQAAGGGLQTSQDLATNELGSKVFLAGVSGQGASYLLFTALLIVAHIRLYKGDRFAQTIGRPFPLFSVREPVIVLLALLYISSAGILVRSVYRIIEMAQGYFGDLYTHEIYTFVLDALPLAISIGVWAVFYPGALVRKIRAETAQRLPSSPAGKEEEGRASPPIRDEHVVDGSVKEAHV